LTTAGAAAVIVGASLAADNQCYPSAQGAGPAYCSPGLSKSGRKAATGLAIAGVGAAAAGYALQPKGPDQLAPAPAPRAPTSPYRLIRKAPPAVTAEAEAGASEVTAPAPATLDPEISAGTPPEATTPPTAPPVEEPPVEEPSAPAPKSEPR
jgi:hypothetical protein